MEKSDLKELSDEVLSGPIGSSLPCNLSDKWLHLIARDLNAYFDGEGKNDEIYLPAPFALMCQLVLDKNGRKSKKVKFSEEEAMNNLRHLYAEISIEIMRRMTDTNLIAATLETIFTNREIDWPKPDCNL